MSNGKKCIPLFSPEDADLAALPWRLNAHGYARTNLRRRGADGVVKETTIFAHRIVGSRLAERLLTRTEYVDHANFDRLDNQRTNLRVTTPLGNSQNLPAKTARGYRGVSFHRGRGKWQAQVKHLDRTHYCGLHETAEEAAVAAESKRAELGFLGAVG